MSHDSKTSSKNKQNLSHTANFLASIFLVSNRSLKKIYNLNPTAIAILRYVCDSIDLNKSHKTKLYQSQIAKFCHCSLRSVSTHIGLLIKKRFLIFDDESCTYKLGWTLFAYANIAYPLEVRKYCVPPRSTQILRTSNSSNITNSGYASVENQSTSFKSQEMIGVLTEKMRTNGLSKIKEIKGSLRLKS